MKTAVISGASGALGSAIRKKLLSENYFVAGLVHRIADQKDQQPETNEKEFEVDLTNEKDTEKIVKEILNLQKEIDVLVCTAGGFAGNSIQNATSADIQRQIDMNFKTAYHLVRPVFDQMKRQGRGRIFLTGSRQGLHPSSGKSAIAYTISKSMLFSLAEILNADSDKNVTVSVVVPSIIDTPANRRDMPDADFTKWATPEQIAEIISYYASDKASVIREPVIKVFNKA